MRRIRRPQFGHHATQSGTPMKPPSKQTGTAGQRRVRRALAQRALEEAKTAEDAMTIDDEQPDH